MLLVTDQISEARKISSLAEPLLVMERIISSIPPRNDKLGQNAGLKISTM